MLTWEEVKAALKTATSMHPEEFARLSADYMPQTIIDQLIHESMAARMSIGRTYDEACMDIGSMMTGFQLGWIVAMKAVSNEE